jgi:hypothetical protein
MRKILLVLLPLVLSCGSGSLTLPTPSPSITAEVDDDETDDEEVDNAEADEEAAETESTSTRTTCVSENVISGLTTPIDLKFVINLTDGARTSLICYILNNSTKAVLALQETSYSSASDCRVNYDIGDGKSSYAWWKFYDGNATDYAVYDNTSGTHLNKTIVFESSNCTTETVD